MLKFFKLSISVFIFSASFAQVKLPRLISDSMILQRDTKVKIWGWASVGEKVTVSFLDKIYSTTTAKDGKWMITLLPMKAGGPYNMDIEASNHITIKNILIGDVWLCSGQSNMELPMERLKDRYPEIIAAANNSNIRQFNVSTRYNFKSAQEDYPSGSWETTTPLSVLHFTAVGYFFGKTLYEKYHVPIGLIKSAVGGSPAEAWLSENALKQFPQYYNEAKKFKDTALINEIQNKDRATQNEWYKQLNEKDEGIKNNWKSPSFNDADWVQMNMPDYWSNVDSNVENGVVWFRKTIEAPASMVNKSARIELGRIVDADSVFINGIYIGNTTYQYPPRKYAVPPGILIQGENVIAIKVISNSGKGGFVLGKPYKLTTVTDTIELKGVWKYKPGASMPPLAAPTFIMWKPLGLYNAMIAPLTNYSIKGVIWYQGESNTSRAAEYAALFSALIKDWRNHFQQNLPFLYVQLANYMEAKEEPAESEWAALRDAQLKTLVVSKTAMIVTIDIGEWNDIHPLDKEDVGKRLALAAENIAYGEKEIVYSGPLYKSMKTDGNKVVISFSNIGSGLIAKDNAALKYFSVAGHDKKFVWAKAIIENNRVTVWSDKISHPGFVRYAWADNPEGVNLYNKEGLPASPFQAMVEDNDKNDLQK